MKNNILLVGFIITSFICLNLKSFAGHDKRDTVYTGIYVTSVHDIDFNQKEYTVNLWLW